MAVATAVRSLTDVAVPRPILRKSQTLGVIRKRNDTELDEDMEDQDSSPGEAKRQRVTFNSDVDVHLLSDMANTAMETELVREEVRNALKQKAEGEDGEYERIKAIFTGQSYTEDLCNPRLFENHILALSSNIALLDTSCDGLVRVILRFNWLARDQSFIRLYLQFLGHLASSHSGHLPNVLRMLVQHFNKVTLHNRPIKGYPLVRRKQMYARVHSAIRYLLQLIPSASSALYSILSTSVPHITDRKRQHVDFARNVLTLASYVPELRSAILGLVTDQILKVDVHVQTEIDDLEDSELVEQLSEPQNPGIGTGGAEDADAIDSTESMSTTEDDSLSEEMKQLNRLRTHITKMDALLDVIFSHYNRHYSANAAIEQREAHFDFLLSQFQTTVLPTFRARHTQFLLFVAAQSSPDFIDRFLGTCLEIVFDSKRSLVVKESAAAYIASFTARAAAITSDVVLAIFQTLGRGLEEYAAGVDPLYQGPDKQRFGTYYAMAQALLYVFCFRWRDLRQPADTLDDEDSDDTDDADDGDGVLNDGLRWCPGVKETLEMSFASRFNPLKICAPDIVAQFAKMAHHLNFLYVYPIIEKNRRVHLFGPSSQQRVGSERAAELEAYFPFDPYRLPLSKRWVVDSYQEWKPILGMDNDPVEV